MNSKIFLAETLWARFYTWTQIVYRVTGIISNDAINRTFMKKSIIMDKPFKTYGNSSWIYNNKVTYYVVLTRMLPIH